MTIRIGPDGKKTVHADLHRGEVKRIAKAARLARRKTRAAERTAEGAKPMESGENR